MLRTVKLSLKYAFTRLGYWFPLSWIVELQASIKYLTVGHWMRDHYFTKFPRVQTKFAVFEGVLSLIRDKPTVYLEFGVATGTSMRYWSNQLKHPNSILHGFDSFEGLPDDWNSDRPKGAFSTGGAIPHIDDNRVKFFKGWFDQVLPTYSIPDDFLKSPYYLVVNLDADLYSSTILVLRAFRPHIKPGVFIYFDELCDPNHELKALTAFLSETGLKLRAVCADVSLTHVFFQCID